MKVKCVPLFQNLVGIFLFFKIKDLVREVESPYTPCEIDGVTPLILNLF